jgi:hypothetical protein
MHSFYGFRGLNPSRVAAQRYATVACNSTSRVLLGRRDGLRFSHV